jgi:hypothetical protein
MTPRREACFFVILIVLMGAAALAVPRDGSEQVWRLHAGMALFLALHAVAGGVAALRGSVAGRVAVAVSLLAGSAAMAIGWLAGFRPPHFLVIDDARQAALGILVSLVASVGLVRRLHWARWLALALAAASMLSNGINLAGFLLASSWWALARAMLVSFFWGASLMASLTGPVVRDAFLARRGGELWASPHRIVTSVRWAILANVVAVCMLLVYAWTQPVVPATALTAQVLAAVLVVAAALAAMRKVVGAVLLVVGGVGLIAHTAATLWLAPPGDGATIVHYYTAFWAPAALLSLVAGAALARPVLALLRR